MHELHEHLTQSLTERLKNRRVVVWYDPRREFTTYVGELVGGEVPTECNLQAVSVAGLSTQLCVMQDSFFAVKFAVEPVIAGDLPDPLLAYLPGKTRDDETSVLMELEAGGDRWEPQLKREARRVLKKRYGDGQIDQMLESENITYQDIVGWLGTEVVTGSLLEVIFVDARGNNADMLAAWLAIDKFDQMIEHKGADRELHQLIASRLGLDLPDSISLEDGRRKTLRYVLLAEFRNDLDGDAPEAIDMVGQPSTKSQWELALNVALALRTRHPLEYIQLADSIEQELHLATQGIAPDRLGSIDTFRFEERTLLEFSGQLIEEGKFDAAIKVIDHRRRSFWALHQMQRQEQWQAYELAAKLGNAVEQIARELPDTKKTAVHWVEGYTNESGWYLADLLHRRLESTLSAMTDPIESEKVIHRVRKDYDEVLDRMTQGFIAAFKASDWTIPGVLHQTQVYDRNVKSPSETVCYFLVDALRYEMGVELKGLLEGAEELCLAPAIAAIPTITPICMAALMPGAEQSFSVVPHKHDLAAKIEGSITGGLAERKKNWKGCVPQVVDLELDKVLSQSNAQLEKKIADAPLILVRSVEIDAMGEGGNTLLARQVLDTAISNVARAIKRLAAVGVAKFVVAADHGHLFVQERDESERIEKPGGDQVSLHRRCWAGRGGSNPPATVRVSAAQLGYDSDLDFVFPTNNSVFKAGGDLTYHHGGLSLQELLVPVLSVRMATKKATPVSDVEVKLLNVPKQIANRIITFGFSLQKTLFSSDEVIVQPVLLSDGQHVGHVGMTLDAEFDPLTHCVKLQPGGSCTVGIQLLRDDIESVEIVILDPASDRILVKSDKIPVRLGM
ncbi:MAG: PglZ domain-containing protein [Planctomycetota bacterium]|nr:PglZ domain-containing protein [Planctomycetota bacterium]